MVVSVHLLLEPSSSLVDAASEDLSLGLLRHLAEILWLNEGTRLQHVAVIFKEFPGEGKATNTPQSPSSHFILCKWNVVSHVILLPSIIARNDHLQGDAEFY